MLTAYLPLLLSALAFVISFVSFFYHKSYIKKRTSQERFLADLREEVNGILKSINETTDRDISLIVELNQKLEEREKTLKTLLADVDKRLKVYIREMETRRGAEEAYRELGKNRFRLPQDSRRESEAHGDAEAQREHQTRREKQNPDSPASSHVKPAPAFPIPEFEVKAESAPGKPPENPPPVGEQIFSLAKAGFSVPVIASRLGISIAEVEFATALLERRDGPG